MEVFYSSDSTIQHIIKSFNLTQTLFVSSIIIGEAHTGKKTLARHLFPHAVLVSGKEQKEVELALESYEELIISDFEKLTNPSKLNFDNKRIIATANYRGNASLIDDLFAFIYNFPSLIERPEDVDYLAQKFITQAQKTLMIAIEPLDLESIPYDLKNNSKSLKKSIYQHLVKQSLDKDDIYTLMHDYLYKNMQGNNNYKEHLGLYEKPLINAGLKKYTSQVKLAEALGINRNTLRKKVQEQDIL